MSCEFQINSQYLNKNELPRQCNLYNKVTKSSQIRVSRGADKMKI